MNTVQTNVEINNVSLKKTPSAPHKPRSDIKLSELMINAKTLITHGEYHLAINLLRVACNRDSKNIQLLNFLAQTLEKVGNFRESEIIRRAVVKMNSNFQSLFLLGTNLYKQNNDEAAMKIYYEALSVITAADPLLFEIYKNLGNILVRQGDFEGAEDFYNKAHTLNSESDVLMVNYGTLEVQRNDFDKSLFCFREAVRINSNNDKAWVGLALVHDQFSDRDLAWANVETAIDINSTNRTALLLVANWAQRDGKVERAIELLKRYLSQVEYDEELSLVLINFQCQSGQLNHAHLESARVHFFNPQNAEIHQLRIQLSDLVGR